MITYNAKPAFFHPEFSKKIVAIEAPDLTISQANNSGTQLLNLCAATEGNGLEKIGEDKLIFDFQELAKVVNGECSYQSLLEQKLSEIIGLQITLEDRV